MGRDYTIPVWRGLIFTSLFLLTGCEASVESSRTSNEKERLQDGIWSIHLPALSQHFATRVASLHSHQCMTSHHDHVPHLRNCLFMFWFCAQAPDDDYFSVHIRIVGDWTTALSKACSSDQNELQDPSKMPRLASLLLSAYMLLEYIRKV